MYCISLIEKDGNIGEKAKTLVKQAQKQLTNEAVKRNLIFDEGMQLFQQGTAESLQQAIDKFKQALSLKCATAYLVSRGDRGIDTVKGVGRSQAKIPNNYAHSAPPARGRQPDRGGRSH